MNNKKVYIVKTGGDTLGVFTNIKKAYDAASTANSEIKGSYNTVLKAIRNDGFYMEHNGIYTEIDIELFYTNKSE